MRTTLGVVLLSTLSAVAQDPPPAASEQVYVTAIELVADVRDGNGKLPPNLTPDDFIVREDGVERMVVGVEYLHAAREARAVVAEAGPAEEGASGESTLWQNVIYFETTLSQAMGRINAAREMQKHVDTLVAMGTVDVVLANPSPVALVRNSRDPVAIRAALRKVASIAGSNRLAAHRRNYLREVDNLNSLTALMKQANRPVRPPELVEPINPRLYIDEEIAMISDFRQSLTAWLSFYRRHIPRNLMLVTDGFDVDPVEFYESSLTPQTKMSLRGESSHSTLAESAARMARMLAAGGWTTVSIPSDNNADGWVDDATVSGIGRMHGGSGTSKSSSPKGFLIRPLDPLRIVAEATGGHIVANSAQLAASLEGLDDRVKVTYQVDRKPDGKARRIEVEARDASLKVRTAHFVTASSPDDVANTRAIQLLRIASYRGDLPTEATIEWSDAGAKSGTLRAVTKVDLVKQFLPPDTKAQFRITLAVQVGNEAVVVNREAPDRDITNTVLRFSTPLQLPRNASRAVVVIEETTTGLWGSARLDLRGVAAAP
jgi:hypothetical protein